MIELWKEERQEFPRWKIPGMRDIMKEVEDNIGRKLFMRTSKMKTRMAFMRRKSRFDVE